MFGVNGVISWLSDTGPGLERLQPHLSWVRWCRWCRGVETDLDVPLWWWCTGCNIIIQIMSRSCVNRSQWTLWWILPPLILSLAAAQTTTDPKTKYTDYTKNKMHYIYVIITYQRINCETEIFPSFSKTESSFLVLSALWGDPGCQSPVFPLLISSDLSTRPIFLPHIQFYCFAAVRRKWNAPALIIIAPC